LYRQCGTRRSTRQIIISLKAPKTALLSLVMLLALISRSVSDEGPWQNDPVIISEQTLISVIVISNPNPHQVIVSIDGRTDLRIDTTQPFPRKLDPHEYVKLREVFVRWPDTSRNRAEKTAGKYGKTQYLQSQSGKHFNDVPIAAIAPLTPTPKPTATPTTSVNPI
jgi:hypothetical protein